MDISTPSLDILVPPSKLFGLLPFRILKSSKVEPLQPSLSGTLRDIKIHKEGYQNICILFLLLDYFIRNFKILPKLIDNLVGLERLF